MKRSPADRARKERIAAAAQRAATEDGAATATYTSKLGVLRIAGSAAGVCAIEFVDGRAPARRAVPDCLRECVDQLDEYFRRERKQFTLKLDLRGTAFQRAVWDQLLTIPFGKTRTYLDIALTIGTRRQVRAVGQANGHNPLSIVVPCHRVIGADGRLTGYGGGLWRKAWLLDFESNAQQMRLL